MEYRKLGSSDVSVSSVVLGTWAIGGWMWGGTDDDNAIAAIHKGVELGMTSIDTAPVYGFGHSETIVGKAVKGMRDRIQILTKYGLIWDGRGGGFHFDTTGAKGNTIRVNRWSDPQSVIEQCEESLRRLGTDYIDLYQCHWPDPSTPVEETMRAMEILHKQGKIRAAGVSNWTVDEISAANKVFPVVSDQPPYSMVKRGIEKDLLPYCRDNNIAVIVYSPLQLGLLSGKMTMDRVFGPNDLRSKSPYFTPENRRRAIDFCNRLRPIASSYGASVAQLVINWTINRPGVTAALVGARNASQAAENAASADLKISNDDAARLDEMVEEISLDLPAAQFA
jgi:aryl-alcohol dehydrogenase-like predicted oxidoreductase